MKLTRRQEEFINNFLDLHQELQGPIHYTELAEKVGVSPFTAYDMLCLLEEKGLVTSEYHRAPEQSGPGRTVRVFLPSAYALAKARRLFEEEEGNLDWEAFKRRRLESVRKGEVPDQELAEEMLARIPPGGPYALRFCVEIMTVIALRLRQRTGRQLLVKYLGELLSGLDAASRSNLSMLGGLAFGILAEESGEDSDWVRELFDHVRQYQSMLIEMDDSLRQRLVEHLIEVFGPLLQQT
jgi:hypothetical protein